MASRYNRQEMMPEIGPEGQQRLHKARVLQVGVGGLGSPISLYLTGAGSGSLTLVDDDKVSLDNLHRQILYSEDLLGQTKVVEAKRRLEALNSEVEITAHDCRLTRENMRELAQGCDLIMDGCDNLPTRYLLDDLSRALGIPYCHGAVQGLRGQCAFFGGRSDSPRYRDLYPDEEAALSLPHPGKEIIGPTAGLVASVMAAQAICYLAGQRPSLDGRLWTIDLGSMESFTIDL